MRSGFTILELLTALALISILSAIALPNLRTTLARWRVDAAARQVVMDLKLVRARAITESATHRLRFPSPASAYVHERQRPSGTYEAVAPPTALPDGITITDCSAVGGGVGFRPRGHAATFGAITLRGERGDERRVVVDIVGRMRVQ